MGSVPAGAPPLPERRAPYFPGILSAMGDCDQKGCEAEAAQRFHWPGSGCKLACTLHALRAIVIADAMGFELVVEPLPGEPKLPARLVVAISKGPEAVQQYAADAAAEFLAESGLGKSS